MNDPVKAKIIELVPEIAGRQPIREGGKVVDYGEGEITLADVLRAIEEKYRVQFYNQHNGDMLSNFKEGLWEVTKDLLHKWNLTKDYDGQTQEVKDSIGKLLNV